MNIQEAKQKVCPFIQHAVVATDQSTTRFDDYTHVNINCITVDCMAWRKINLNPDDGYCQRLSE